MIDEIYNYRHNMMNSYHFSDEWEKLGVKFENTLTEEQLKIFHKLSGGCKVLRLLMRSELRASWASSTAWL